MAYGFLGHFHAWGTHQFMQTHTCNKFLKTRTSHWVWLITGPLPPEHQESGTGSLHITDLMNTASTLKKLLLFCFLLLQSTFNFQFVIICVHPWKFKHRTVEHSLRQKSGPLRPSLTSILFSASCRHTLATSFT